MSGWKKGLSNAGFAEELDLGLMRLIVAGSGTDYVWSVAPFVDGRQNVAGAADSLEQAKLAVEAEARSILRRALQQLGDA